MARESYRWWVWNRRLAARGSRGGAGARSRFFPTHERYGSTI